MSYKTIKFNTMEHITEKTIGDYRIRTFYDESPESPRNWDNLGTMVCFHRNYDLGDKHDYNSNDYNGWNEMEKDIIKKEKVGVILPLYLTEIVSSLTSLIFFSMTLQNKI